MDSDRLEASEFEDFVRVEGGNGSSNSEGSDESIVEERGADEVSSVNEEGQTQPYERKVLPEEFSRNIMTLTYESSVEEGILPRSRSCDQFLETSGHFLREMLKSCGSTYTS